MNDKKNILDAADGYPLRASIFLIVCLVAVWTGLLLVDWYGRFEIFHWQNGLFRQPLRTVSTLGPEAPMLNRMDPSVLGGDLTQLISIDALVDEFGEWKPETPVVTDEYGYRNTPPTEDVYYPVVVSGDSFLHRRYGTGGSYAEFLSDDLGIPVYNHSFPGKGAFWGVFRFLSDPRFRKDMPKVLVWGCLEREISGIAFAGFVFQVWHLEHPKEDEGAESKQYSGFAWERIAPSKLRKSLPDSSILAAASTKAWNKLRYLLFRTITDDVLVSLPDEKNDRQLFYGISLEALSWPREVRDPEKVAWAAEYIRNFCLTNGMELMVMLIPDKESVYREQIPVSSFGDPATWPPSTLFDVEVALREKGIPVVNLLPGFRNEVEKGVRLYWRDDTHWRPEAMQIAASLTEPVLRDIINK